MKYRSTPMFSSSRKLAAKILLVPLAAILLAACGGTTAEPPPPPASRAGILVSIHVTPAAPSLVINTTQRYVATGKDADGNAVAISPKWHVVAGGGTIDTSGLFTA